MVPSLLHYPEMWGADIVSIAIERGARAARGASGLWTSGTPPGEDPYEVCSERHECQRDHAASASLSLYCFARVPLQAHIWGLRCYADPSRVAPVVAIVR